MKLGKAALILIMTPMMLMAGIEGTYKLSKDGMEEAALAAMKTEIDKMMANATPEVKAAQQGQMSMMENQVKQAIASMEITMDVKKDGSVTVNGTAMGKPMTSKGTWTLENDQYVFAFHETDGQDHSSTPNIMKIKYDNDTIRFTPDPSMPFEFVMIKQ